ncbi:hypothetical protein AAVH_06446 [Aphelenchoides avenae]|nr:hypothetical protein AAVH_06446 [Aphelenchus avenae]
MSRKTSSCFVLVLVLAAALTETDAMVLRSNPNLDLEPHQASLNAADSEVASFRQQEKDARLFDQLLPQLRDSRLYGSLPKRSSNFADFRRNCYFSPVQCVLLERRRRR